LTELRSIRSSRTSLRAWKSLDTFAARGHQPIIDGEIGYLQPYPDQLTDHDADPATAVATIFDLPR
jgi:hypothetical protein